MTIEEKDRPSTSQETTRENRQIVIEIPEHIDVSPAVIFRYLAEKLSDTSDDQEAVISSDYLFRPVHKTSSSTRINGNPSRYSISPLDHSMMDSHSSSEVNFIFDEKDLFIGIFHRFPKLNQACSFLRSKLIHRIS